MCPQATTKWEYVQPVFILDYLNNLPFTLSTDISSYIYVPTIQNPLVSEDCLFLDITVPKKVFDRTKAKKSTGKNLAPVLVWIYGGGFVRGDKTDENPRGLVERSTVAGHDGVVFVTLNYRVSKTITVCCQNTNVSQTGAFGWLGGDSVTSNGTANAAFHDQRFALDWVNKNIHLFGGDSSRVTVMGGSAGGASILHHITAYGGDQGAAPFQQAIIQSPGWVPVISKEAQEETLQEFLGFLNVGTIEEARTLSSDKLIAANSDQIATKSKWGEFTYGPTVDGTFVPALPGQLLLEGKFDRNVNVMVTHVADEALIFTSPESYKSTGLASQMSNFIPNSPKKVTDYILDVLYPPVYNGSYGYKDSVARSALVLSDMLFQCNTDYINRAFEKTYAYEFNIPPALHGQDSSYTFYTTGEPVINNTDVISALWSIRNATVAMAMQDYFLSFTEHGVPKSSLAPTMEPWAPRAQLMRIEHDNIQPAHDSTNNPRCRFWQEATASYSQ